RRTGAANRSVGVVGHGIRKGTDHFDAEAILALDQAAVGDRRGGDRAAAVAVVDQDAVAGVRRVAIGRVRRQRAADDTAGGVVGDRAAACGDALRIVAAPLRAETEYVARIVQRENAIDVDAVAVGSEGVGRHSA